MVRHNTLRTREGKHGFKKNVKFFTADLNKNERISKMKRMALLLYACAPISVLPSNIATMVI